MNKNKFELRLEKYRDIIWAIFMLFGLLGGLLQWVECFIDILK